MKDVLAELEAVNKYCILHGWQDLPEYLSSDLDIVVAPEDLSKLEKELTRSKKVRVVNHLRHESTCDYFVLAFEKCGKIHFLPIDSATDYRRNGRIWFNADELLNGRKRWKDFWVAAPEVEFKYTLVKKILKQDIPLYSKTRLQELVEELGPTAAEEARKTLGLMWGVRVIDWIRSGDWESVEANLPALKRLLKWNCLKQDPLNPIRYWFAELKRIWQRWYHPTGLWGAIFGPDGSGKSTLISNLERDLLGAFRKTTHFHLMPGIIRKQAKSGPVTDPHGKPLRSIPISLLKLFYYFLDYNLGYWLKIRPSLVRSTLVLFDRYYDDLLIDPKRYRFGGPLKFVRWMQPFIPRPDISLVVDVPVNKLLERKQEVPFEEVQRQHKVYRIFTMETPNTFLLDGDLPPEQVTQEAKEILLDVLHKQYLDLRKLWFPHIEKDEEREYLEKSLGLRISKEHPTHAYMRLPDGRGYLLPLSNNRVFQRGLELYPAQERKARFGKGLFHILAKAGFKGPGLARFCFQEVDGAIFQILRNVINGNDLCFAISLGTPGPHRKPVVQVLTQEGEVLGYAKVGWNDATKLLIKNEAEVLKRFDKDEFPFGIPKLLYTSETEGKILCLQSPSPKGSRLAPRQWSREYSEVLRALASKGVYQEPLQHTNFWQQIMSRVSELRNSYWKRVLLQTSRKVLQDWEGKEVLLHLAHGDFAPWNAFQVENRIYIYDWEYAQQEAPAGYDLFHFMVQTMNLLEHRTPADIIQTILQFRDTKHMEYWNQLSISKESIKNLFKLYALERLSFYSVMELSNIKQQWFFRSILQGVCY